MAVFDKVVVDVRKASKGKRYWTKAVTVWRGEQKDSHIFDEAAQKLLKEKGPGLYAFDMEKTEKGWDVNAVAWKGPLAESDRIPDQEWRGAGAAAAPAQAPAGAPATAPQPSAAAVVATIGRVEVTLRCLEAAALLVSAGIKAGRYEGAELDNIITDTKTVTGALMNAVKDTAHAPAPAAATKAPEGA